MIGFRTTPVRGEKSTFRTDVRIAYDERYLYFAFHCFDPEPTKIRATISRRDNVFNDDWIGLSLDSAATGQTSYHLMVNPSGIQMDALNTPSSGEKFPSESETYGNQMPKVTVPLVSIAPSVPSGSNVIAMVTSPSSVE